MKLRNDILSDIEVLVTRPKIQGEQWQAKLQALGATTFLVPLLDIIPVKSPENIQRLKSIVLKLDEFKKIIFISQNAVTEAVKWIDDYWPQHPVGIEYFAVGAATASLATHLGFFVREPGQAMNSESLLALEGIKDVEGEKILIFRGVGGRDYLSNELTKRGAIVTYAELYHREMPATAIDKICGLKLGKSGRKTVLSAHSGESLENLCLAINRGIEQDLKTAFDFSQLKICPLLVPGERVAALANSLGFDHLIVAKNATDFEMTQALCHWQNNKD